MMFDNKLTAALIAGLILASATHVYAMAPQQGSRELIDAIMSGNLAQVQALIATGVDLNSQNHGLYGSGFTALHTAARYGKTDIARALIAAGANINTHNPDQYGDTALHAAARYGYTETVRALIAAGANLEARNSLGHTPLTVAASEARPENSFAALQAMQALSDLGRPTPPDFVGTLQTLIAAGANLEAQDQEGNTALMLATKQKATKAVQLLIAAGANLEAQNQKGNTALMCAAQNGCAEAAQILITAGANLEAQDQEGSTALFYAVTSSSGNTETVRTLIAAGANLEAQHNSGLTAFSAATANNRTDIVQALITAGANIYLSPQAIQNLIAAGHNMHMPNQPGQTVIPLVRNAEIIKMITAVHKQNVQKRFREVCRTLLLTQKRLQKTDPENPMARMPLELIVEQAKAKVRAEFQDVPEEWFVEVLNNQRTPAQAGPAGV